MEHYIGVHGTAWRSIGLVVNSDHAILAVSTGKPIHLHEHSDNENYTSLQTLILELLDEANYSPMDKGIKRICVVCPGVRTEHDIIRLKEILCAGGWAGIHHVITDDSIAALNQDDPSVRGIKDTITGRVVTFGIKEKADIVAENIKLSSRSTSFDLVINNKRTIHVTTKLIGGHNVYNILASVAALIESGIGLNVFEKALNEAEPVPGRLELVTDKIPFQIFIDYAHTPDALENVLKCLKDLSENKLICVFGCGGDRDKTKRPVMGKIASEICDRVIITSDNPRTEDPQEIINEIEKGVFKNADYSIILDRKKAIFEAIDKANEKDIVIIAGKGHEDYQIIGDKVLEFDEKGIQLKDLAELVADALEM